MTAIRVFTIGFTQTTAKHFFWRLSEAGVHRVLDVRINRASQLSGFAKGQDLPYLLKNLTGADYLHVPLLTTPADLLSRYTQKKITWEDFEREFVEVLWRREVRDELRPEMFNRACLLCSEASAVRCHRRLALEFLDTVWQDVSMVVTHL